MNSNSTELEQVIHKRQTSDQNSLVHQILILTSENLLLSERVPVMAPTHLFPAAVLIPVHMKHGRNLSNM